jgi:AGZA family xanthine/uracil permease-like MFS transporter
MNKISLRTEFIAGLTTFLTMSYIIFVNPAILAAPGTGMSFTGVMTATVLLSALMTIAMGLIARLPFAIAPGMGLNAFFTYTLVLGEQIPWPVALGMVFWSGVFFMIISLTPLREKFAESLPHNIKIAAAVGIGLFLMFIGLKNCGLITADPATFVRMGAIRGNALVAVLGLIVILALMRRKHPLAFLAGIFIVCLVTFFQGGIQLPERLLSAPDFSSVFFKMDLWGALKLALLPAILSMVFTDMFDSVSTFVGVSRAAGLVDEKGNPLRMKQALAVDAAATMLAGPFGSSAGTAYIESAAGVEAGGRTGLTAIFTGLLFLPCLFIAPLVGIVPAHATGPVLIVVGFLMFKNIVELHFEKMEEWIPAAATVVLIPLSFSITKGLMAGLFLYAALHILAGRWRELPVALWLLGITSAAYLAT